MVGFRSKSRDGETIQKTRKKSTPALSLYRIVFDSHCFLGKGDGEKRARLDGSSQSQVRNSAPNFKIISFILFCFNDQEEDKEKKAKLENVKKVNVSDPVKTLKTLFLLYLLLYLFARRSMERN